MKYVITAGLIIFSLFLLMLSGCTAPELECSGSAPYKCNNQCWSCGANQIFKCESSGGTCSANASNCPSSMPNSCNDTCWANCDSDKKFVCDAFSGATCQIK